MSQHSSRRGHIAHLFRSDLGHTGPVYAWQRWKLEIEIEREETLMAAQIGQFKIAYSISGIVHQEPGQWLYIHKYGLSIVDHIAVILQ